MRNLSSVKLQSYEDIFGEETSDIRDIPVEKLLPFPNHPYSVPDNDELEQLTESIRKNGILHPLSVIPAGDESYYIISGHRRKAAAEKAELMNLPCMIREITMDQATVEMVDANLYREHILPSEKAKAYAMKRDAIRRLRNEDPGYVEKGKRTAEALAEEVADSKATIHRYLRLNELVPEFLAMVDEEKMIMATAVELSYIPREEQKIIFDMASDRETPIQMEEAEELRRVSALHPLSKQKVEDILCPGQKTTARALSVPTTAKELNRQAMKGYILAASDSIGLDSKTVGKLQGELDNILASMTGREAREYLERRELRQNPSVSQ